MSDGHHQCSQNDIDFRIQVISYASKVAQVILGSRIQIAVTSAVHGSMIPGDNLSSWDCTHIEYLESYPGQVLESCNPQPPTGA